MADALANLMEDSPTYDEHMLEAVRKLASGKPWKGSFDRRLDLLSTCVRELCKARGGTMWQLVHTGKKTGSSTLSKLQPQLHRINITGRLSVVTVLMLFAGSAENMTRFEEVRWSLCLFRLCFPRSFARCTLSDGLIVNTGRRDD